jgi:hypothetical protein
MERRTEVDGFFRLAFGTPVLSTSGRAHGRRASWSVDTYDDQPAEDAFTLATVGLCDTPLEQELLLCAWNAQKSDALYNTLFTVADELVTRGLPVDAGSLLELPAPIVPRSFLRHLFAFEPLYHFQEVPVIDTAAGPVQMLWLIPVTDKEAEFIEEHGPQAFDDLLAERDPDLLDLLRPSAI